ncbi:MAG: hypothetical protein ACRDYE_15765, partial [Acidimicrobiales bacterium]
MRRREAVGSVFARSPRIPTLLAPILLVANLFAPALAPAAPSGTRFRRNRPGRPRVIQTLLAVALTGAVMLVGAGAMTLAAGPAEAASIGAAQPRVYQGGGVIGFGDAASINAPIGSALSSVMVGVAANPASSPGNQGYWLAAADGGVFAQGNAGFYGSLGALRLQGPVVGIAPTPDGQGYWLVALDGGVFSFGDADFYGSMGAVHLNQPVVGMA